MDRIEAARIDELARRHLWMHFTRLESYADSPIPMIERGEGAYVFDSNGKRYFDGLAGLFVVMVGHGRKELAQAAATQAEKLAFFPEWGYAHPMAAELAARMANGAPGDINRVFFTNGGGSAVESAWKLARAYFKATGEPGRTKIIGRHLAYHGTTMGALSITGVPAIRETYAPLVPGARHAANTNRYRCTFCSKSNACNLMCANDIEEIIEREGADTIAAFIAEPLQNTGGCFPPPPGYWQEIREICDRHGILLISDEVICAFGRLGHMYGSDRYGYQPDIITVAKGLTSGYAPLGAMLVSDKLVEPFLRDRRAFLHGFTYGAHPVACAVAMANLDLMEKEDLYGNVLANEDYFYQSLRGLMDNPIVGDVRGAGYFYGLELVKDKDTKETFNDDESEKLLRGFLSPTLFDRGLICRADDRGDPVIQLAPPLITTREQIDEVTGILRGVLTDAVAHMSL